MRGKLWRIWNRCLLLVHRHEELKRFLSVVVFPFYYWGLGWFLGSKKKEMGNAGDAGDNGFDSWVAKIPWRKAWQPAPVFLPGNPTDRGAWQVTVHGGGKESDTIEAHI